MTAPPDDTTADTSAIIEALRAERDAALARRKTDFDERINHQAATIDVLKAMSASPDDAQPVFDVIIHHAKDLCGGVVAGLFEFDGTLVHHRSASGIEPAALSAVTAMYPMVPTRNSTVCRAILDKQIVHIRDVDAEPGFSEAARNVPRKSQISIPLLRDGSAIGAILLGARDPGGFTDSQIALLETFAEQAVIAITSAETYRTLQTRTSDLQETLEYQTATGDVLKVISRSTFDLQPVLDTVVETAAQLCEADLAVIVRHEGDDEWRLAANFGFPPEYEAYVKTLGAAKFDPDRPTVVHRTAIAGRPVHIVDVAAVPGYPEAFIRLGKQRTALGVPLLRGGELIGVIQLGRQRVEPFTDRQIELVCTFADQAVIAIENTRLIIEQREALEQQTATAGVLQVINASPGNLAPVFDAVLERALRLCGASFGTLLTYDGEHLERVAFLGVPPAFIEYNQRNPLTKNAALVAEGIATRKPVQATDIMTDARMATSPSVRDALVELGGVRALLQVPLLKDEAVVGFIAVWRREPGVFPDTQIALVEGFAAQAVIAMENARLLAELRQRTSDLQQSLEYQTATSDVLKVISRSTFDLQPVLDTVVATAKRLCDADQAMIFNFDDGMVHLTANIGFPPEYQASFDARGLTRLAPNSPGVLARAIRERRVVHVHDAAAVQGYPEAAVKLRNVRTALGVPFLREDEPIGVIVLSRKHVEPFTEQQVALVSTFADQAVIAIENTRLITEQKEALEQQTATAEVLQVINASPGDLTPVFDAMLEKAMRLCGAAFGLLYTYDGELFHTVAHRGVPAALAEFRSRHPPAARPGGSAAPLIETMRPVHILDMMEQEFYRAGDAINRATVDFGGARTTLTVPLLKDDALLGVISIYRQEVRAFSAKQIALLEGFATQAVIAMENARLLDEIRQRQEELRITFENMGDGVAMFGETQHLVAWNRKFQDIQDVPDEIIARRKTFSEYVHYLAERGEYGAEADPEEYVRGLIEQAGQSRTYERTRPDGRVIEIRHNPVAGGGFVLIFSDITERKRSEAEVRAARDAAEEASRTIEAAYRDLKTAQANLIQAEKMASLGQLTAGIAHEIKNPLNFVNNFAALSVDLLSELKETAAPGFAVLTEKQRAEVEDVSAMLTSNLEKITEHGKRADGIVKAMLEHSRGSSGERRVVDLNTLIDEALNLAYHGARAQDQSFNITLEREFGEGIAAIEVNPQDMTRVFLNLFANGFYATSKRAHEGGDAGFAPTLQVTTRDTGEVVEVRVRDNGIGIPAGIKDRLFEPFFSTKPTGQGTGLGLSITYDIVTQQHGGTIAADSNVGEYSEFTIRLPRRP